jgi:Family of unknown function (DUF5678)
MSSVAFDQLRDQLLRLPPDIIRTLRAALELEPKDRQKLLDELPDQEPLDRRVPPIPMPDYKNALQWLADHAREYAGQWVALDGARLIAHGPDHHQVFAAAKADGAYLPLIELVEDPDAPPFAGF